MREPGKTRGAIGFALIFLCFVSLYQDKEMKRKDKEKRLKYLGFEITTFGVLEVLGLLISYADLGFGIKDLG
jgi:hypothetical protein